jgi:hypothetical protein
MFKGQMVTGRNVLSFLSAFRIYVFCSTWEPAISWICMSASEGDLISHRFPYILLYMEFNHAIFKKVFLYLYSGGSVFAFAFEHDGIASTTVF